jgi:hypothetical protein
LRVVQDVFDAVDGAVRHAVLGEMSDPVRGVLFEEAAGEQGIELVPVRHAVAVAGEARVAGELPDLHRLHHAAEQGIVQRADDDVPVSGRVRLVGHDVRRSGPHLAGGRRAGGVVADRPVEQPGDLGVEH